MLSLFPCLVLQAPAGDAPTLALVDVSVVDVRAGALRAHQTLLLAAGRIAALGPAAEVTVPAEAEVLVRGAGHVLPGLWDMHVHLTDSTELVLPVLLAFGVTGVRDMGGDLALLDRWRQRIEAGELAGPRIVRAGPYLDGDKPGLPYRVTLASPADARRAVGELAAVGVDFLKVHNLVPREAFLELARAARERGLPFAGHIPVSVTPLEAVEGGQRSIEHLTTFFEAAFVPSKPADPAALMAAMADYVHRGAAPLVAALRRAGTWVTPNLVALDTRARRAELARHPDARLRLIAGSLRHQWDEYFPVRPEDGRAEVVAARTRFLELMLEWTKELHDAGVPLLLGTDLALRDVFPGASVLDELELLQRAGLTPAEALRTATLEPARYLGREDELGTLEPGKLADLLVLDANPLETLAALRNPRGVVARGRWHPRVELERWLEEAARRAAER